MQLYANKMDNLEEMDKFFKRYTLPKTKPGKKQKKMNRPITSAKIESVILKLPRSKSPGPDGFTGEFYQAFRDELILILLKLQKIAEEGTLLNSSSEATITLIPKPDRYHTCKKKTTGKYNQYRGKNPE